MKMKLISLVLCAGLGLTSCTTKVDPTTGVTTTVPDPQFAETLAQIKAGILQTCGYSATIGSIAAIVGTFVPGVSVVPSVVSAICGAVTAKSVRRGGPRPQVNGLPVEGHFVR